MTHSRTETRNRQWVELSWTEWGEKIQQPVNHSPCLFIQQNITFPRKSLTPTPHPSLATCFCVGLPKSSEQAYIEFESIEAIVKTASRTKFFIEFYSTCLEGEMNIHQNPLGTYSTDSVDVIKKIVSVSSFRICPPSLPISGSQYTFLARIHRWPVLHPHPSRSPCTLEWNAIENISLLFFPPRSPVSSPPPTVPCISLSLSLICRV